MNHFFKLNSRFWLLDKQQPFTPHETRLFFYLLNVANEAGWPETIAHSDKRTCANASLSINGMKKARTRLEEAGLFFVEAGGRGKGDSSRYHFRYHETTPKVIPNVIPKPALVAPLVSVKVSPGDTNSIYKRLKTSYSLSQKGVREKVSQLFLLQKRKLNRKAPLVPRVPPRNEIPMRTDPFTIKRDSERVNVPFSEWYPTYQLNIAEAQCRKLWLLLTNSERSKAKAHTLLYVKSTPNKRFRKAPTNYLEEKTFNDEIIERHDQPKTFHSSASAADRRRELAKPRPGTRFGKL